MTSFDELLESLHDHSSLQDTYMSDEQVITINAKRNFVPGKDFDTTIAFEGDINSQIVTFKCVRVSDNHDLSLCANKELKWKNLKSGMEGISKLELISDINAITSDFYLKWEVAPEACTEAGILEISISFYDKKDGLKAFSWNTSSYQGLSIGKSMSSVGFDFPPKDEILIVDSETKNIIAPPGYNNIICNYGDVGIARVCFLIERHIGKKKDLDVYNDSTKIYLYAKQNNKMLIEGLELNSKQLYTNEIEDRNKEGLVFFEWIPDANFTCSETSLHNIGKFDISLKFEYEKAGPKILNTNVYKNLELGNSPMMITTSDPDEPEEIPVNSITDIIDNHYLKTDRTFKKEYMSSTDIADIVDEHYLSGGQIKASYLPSYVDDVLEYSELLNFPSEGETGKIYVDLSSGITYRWTGSTYIEVGTGTYTNNKPTTITVGGITKGSTFENKKITELFNDLLYPYVSFSIKSVARSAAATVLAYGQTQILSSVSVIITLGSKDITEIILYNADDELVKMVNPVIQNEVAVKLEGFDAITVSKNNNPNLRVVVKDGTNTIEKSLGVSTFVAPYYYGVCATNVKIDSTFIKSLTPIVQTRGDKSVKFTANNQHILFAYPSQYGELIQIKNQNGQVDTGSFTLLNTIVVGDDGIGREYYVYKLTLPTTVTNFGYTFDI